MKLLSTVWNKVRPRTNRELYEDYLALSKNNFDLERRMRMLDRGEAPWQKYGY